MTIHDIANECWLYGTRYGEETAGGEVWWRGVETKLIMLTDADSPERQEVRRLIRERLAGAPLDPPTSTLTASCSRCGVLFATGAGRNTIPTHDGEYCDACLAKITAHLTAPHNDL